MTNEKGEWVSQRNRLPTAEDRFWSKVKKSDDPDGCWEWQTHLSNKGYGFFSYHGKNVGAHRRSYEMAYGEIKDGLHVLHTCDNPPCIRPDHLKLGTMADNVKDMIKKGRSPLFIKNKNVDGQITHCIRGHEFTPKNTYMNGKSKKCKACWKARQLESEEV